jgi:heat shock protein HslJ
MLLISLLLAGTAFKEKDRDKGDAVTGTWIVSSLPGADITTHTSMKLILDPAKKTIMMTAICNVFNGSYSLDTKNSALQFKSLTTTWKACKEIKAEQQLMDALKAVTHYKSDKHTLRLFRNNELLVTLVRVR